MFEVVGGVYTDLSFKTPQKGKEEYYGPFDDYEDAYDIWKARMWTNVDNSLHRLRINELGPKGK